jgi:translation elongation factor EF-Ts
VLGTYVHGKLHEEDCGGLLQIGSQSATVILRVNPPVVSDDVQTQLTTAARKLAMHVVAASPQFLSVADAPAALVEREQAIFA